MKRIALGATAALCLFGCGLLGCTTSPPTPSATVNAETINYAILSELYCAANAPEFQDYFASNDNWVAAVDLYLSASIEGVASPVVSLLGPYNFNRAIPLGGNTGSFAAAVGASVDQTRTNLSEYKTIIFMKTFLHSGNYKVPDPSDPKKTIRIPDWKEYVKNIWVVDCDNPLTYGTYLAGHLGLEDWLKPAVYTQQSTEHYAPPPSPTSSQTPQVKGVKPDQGLANPPTPTHVVISGNNIDGGTVIFGTQADSSPGTEPGTLNATVPPYGNAPKNTVDVFVATSNGISRRDKKDQFTYTSGSDNDQPKGGQQDEAIIQQLNTKLNTLAFALAAGTGTQSSGGAQAPTISATFTFTIKAGGTLGTSFTLSRVSSNNSSSLFSLTRTDNNYVNIVLTPSTFCWTTLVPSKDKPSQLQCPPLPDNPALIGAGLSEVNALIKKRPEAARAQPAPADIQSAVDRINTALFNLNLAHAFSP